MLSSLLFTGRNHLQGLQKTKLQDRDIAMISAANVFKKTKGGQSI